MENTELLLVEDNMDDAELTISAIQKNLKNRSFLHLRDGEEALNFIFRKNEYAGLIHKANPKLILLDIKMSKVNGLEFLEIIKKDPETRDIPVVILTSSNESPDILQAYKLGVNSYIVKPVTFDSFIEAVSITGQYWLNFNKTTQLN